MEHGQPSSQPYSQNQFQRSNLFKNPPSEEVFLNKYEFWTGFQRMNFKTNLNVGIDSENRVGKRVAHAP